MTGEIVDCGLWILDCKAPSARRPGSSGFLLPLHLIPEPVEGSKGRGGGYEGRGDIGVRFDRLNELRGEAGKVLELVERPGVGAACERGSPLGVRFDPSTSSTNLRVGRSPRLAPLTRGVGGFPWAQRTEGEKVPALAPPRASRKPKDFLGNDGLEYPVRSSFPRKRESGGWIPVSAEPAPGSNGGMTGKTCLRDRLVGDCRLQTSPCPLRGSP